MNINIQVGDFVHITGEDPTTTGYPPIYEVIKASPVWYKGRNNVTLQDIKHRRSAYRHAPKYKLVLTEPELLF